MKLAIAANHIEEIVEIVCDTACQAADRFKLLRLAQLLFQDKPFCPITR